jgi:hypothetical protein
MALSEAIVCYLITFLAGYLIGKEIGLEYGREKSAAAIPIELRERSLEQGCCVLCGTDFTAAEENETAVSSSTENAPNHLN